VNTVAAVVIAALTSGAFVGVVTVVANRKKTKAETSDIVAQAAERILGNYMEDNEALRTKVKSLEEQNASQARQIRILTEQLRRMAHALRRAGVDPDLAAEGEL
jgi:uncharacterized membrane protein